MENPIKAANARSVRAERCNSGNTFSFRVVRRPRNTSPGEALVPKWVTLARVPGHENHREFESLRSPPGKVEPNWRCRHGGLGPLEQHLGVPLDTQHRHGSMLHELAP